MGKSRGRWRQKLAEDQGRTLIFPTSENINSLEKKPDSKLSEKLLAKAEEHVEAFEYDSAKQCYESILNEEPSNVVALEAYAGVLLELKEIELAENALNQAASLSPNDGHNKFFSLGQLNEGKKSLDFYLKGIEIVCKLVQQQDEMASAAADTNDSENPDNLRLDMSNAYCAMAEIYMTDCCDEGDAENQCKSFIQKAIESCPTNPEAFQSQANYQLVKGEVEEAKESMLKSLSFWLPKYKESREGTETVDDCPLSYDSRITTSKVLIELEMYPEASDILEGLLDENDQVVDVWYLLGWLNYLHGEDYYGNARFYLEKTKEISSKLGDEDDDQIQHVEELLIELGPETEEDGSDEESKDSDDWETEDEMET